MGGSIITSRKLGSSVRAAASDAAEPDFAPESVQEHRFEIFMTHIGLKRGSW